MHASACESLLPFLHPNARVLDIGCGSGYLTHVLANLIGDEGKVVGVDHIQGLVELAHDNMEKSEDGKAMLSGGKVELVKGDGRLGWPQGAPYDAIHVGAAAKELHPGLVDQLKKPGRMFIPVEENYAQYIWVVDKKEDGSIERKKLYGVQYVPLTDAPPV
jgi:protein-L-isoaspartate(D-aspartate) O-methyltransferase